MKITAVILRLAELWVCGAVVSKEAGRGAQKHQWAETVTLLGNPSERAVSSLRVSGRPRGT